MAGNLNSDSVIWNVGDATGKNQLGETTAIPDSILTTAEDYADSAVDVLHDRLVASGILES